MTARVMGWVAGAGRVDARLGELARLGATPDNDVVVRVEGVSRSHARIVNEQDAYWVEDANSRNGTWVNGARVKRARLRHLDVITLGRFAELVFVERASTEPDQRAPAAKVRVRLEWLDGVRSGGAADVPAGETLMGRAESCAIVVDTPAVSRAHARLSISGGRVVIEDLGSANGTVVDGQPLRGPMAITSGAEVVLGGAQRFRVVIEGLPATPAADTQIGATPAASQDMEWATRLVFSATDLEAVSTAAGGIDTPGPATAVQVPTAVPLPPPAAPRATSGSRMPSPAASVTSVVESTRHGAGDLRLPPGLAPTPPAAAPAGEPASPADTHVEVRAPVAAPRFAPAHNQAGPGAPDRTLIDADASPASGKNLPLGVRPPVRKAATRVMAVQLAGEAGAFTLAPGTATVGRSPETTVRIDNKQLSRVHAAITVTEHEVTVEDRGSVNGTSVNGTAVTSPTRLTSGDRLSFAGLEFVVTVIWTEGH